MMRRLYLNVFMLVAAIFLVSAGLVFPETLSVNFEGENPGAPSKYFSSFVGYWHIDRDGSNTVYAVDGRKWARGTMAKGIAEKAKAMYGERYAEFLDNIQAYKYFPLTIFKNVDKMDRGEISVDFKTISGRIDQAAGIAFDIKKNGDYLVIRANALEKNIVMFRLKNGRRSVVQWIRNVPIASKRWYTLKVVLGDGYIQGYLNGKRYINYKKSVSGKIGLWSKADSYVFFDNFTVKVK